MESLSFIDMDEIVKLLLELQKIDSRIDDLKKRKTTIPEEISTLRKEIDDLKKEKEKFLEKIKEEILAQKRLEHEIESLGDEIEEYRRKSREVKTNEEYRAMLQQIEFSEKKKEELEEALYKKMEEVEQLQQEKDVKTQEFDNLIKEKESLINSLQKELNSLDDFIQEVEEIRKREIAHIPQKELLLYERIRKKRGRVVVNVKAVRDIDNNITGYVCGGCHAELPTQFVNELKLAKTLKRCANCGRLIYWDEEDL